jgi:hypothetical protein
MAASTEKKRRGQFYTVNHDYILDGFELPPAGTAQRIVEPFAGKGDLLEWLKTKGSTLPVEAYDIDPKAPGIVSRDTLMNPPDYNQAWILTNPPYLARNKSSEKALFDAYNTNDLYKCFIHSVAQADVAGGILIIPAGFFLSPRDLDVRCRSAFLSRYRLIKVKYFEEQVFPETGTTVVAFQFVKAAATLTEQTVEWVSRPTGAVKQFTLKASDGWIIGGDIYRLPPAVGWNVRRYVEGQALRTGEQLTNMTLHALDSGTQAGRIHLEYKEGYVYPAKDCSRTFATLCVEGGVLSPDQQKQLCVRFNTLLETARAETWSLFLPQYRESKEYARKRIPFELAYTIVLHCLQAV